MGDKIKQTPAVASSGPTGSDEPGQPELDCSNNQVEAAMEITDEDFPEYNAEQMHMMIEETTLTLLEQLRETPRWQGASAQQVTALVAEHKSTYALGDGRMYSKTQ